MLFGVYVKCYTDCIENKRMIEQSLPFSFFRSCVPKPDVSFSVTFELDKDISSFGTSTSFLIFLINCSSFILFNNLSSFMLSSDSNATD